MFDCPDAVHEAMDMATTIYEQYYDFLENEQLLLPTNDLSPLAPADWTYEQAAFLLDRTGFGGTDHGAAAPMFVIGKGVKPGYHGDFPSLIDLDDGDLKMTTDLRSVYANVLEEWIGLDSAAGILKGDYSALGLFRTVKA